jgi:hypothetical protein
MGARKPCKRCGNIHERCSAHNSRGKPCGRPPRAGAKVCPSHGGAAPQVKRAAAERRAEQQAAATLGSLGAAAPVGNPLEHLLRLAGEVEQWLAVTRHRMTETEHLILIGDGGEDARAIVKLYERALDKAAGVLTAIAKLDIEARLTAIAERDLARVEAAYGEVWRAGRDGATLDEARARAARHLRAVS